MIKLKTIALLCGSLFLSGLAAATEEPDVVEPDSESLPEDNFVEK